MPSVPDRWLNYSPVGKRVEGTRFVAFKVPLRQRINVSVAADKRLDDFILLEKLPNLGLIIDLTNTKRYYDPQTFTNAGIQHLKISVPGHLTPDKNLRKLFNEGVTKFLQENSDNDKLIGVHCTHGVNRTGFFICNYMITQQEMDPKDAITKFKNARGHGIERENYLRALYKLPETINSMPSSDDVEEELASRQYGAVSSELEIPREPENWRLGTSNSHVSHYRPCNNWNLNWRSGTVDGPQPHADETANWREAQFTNQPTHHNYTTTSRRRRLSDRRNDQCDVSSRRGSREIDSSKIRKVEDAQNGAEHYGGQSRSSRNGNDRRESRHYGRRDRRDDNRSERRGTERNLRGGSSSFDERHQSRAVAAHRSEFDRSADGYQASHYSSSSRRAVNGYAPELSSNPVVANDLYNGAASNFQNRNDNGNYASYSRNEQRYDRRNARRDDTRPYAHNASHSANFQQPQTQTAEQFERSGNYLLGIPPSAPDKRNFHRSKYQWHQKNQPVQRR